MRLNVTRIAATALVLVMGTRATAAGVPEHAVQIGERVRVHSPQLGATPVIGTLLSIDDDVLRLSVPHSTAPLVVERSQIDRLDVSRRGRHPVRGGFVGFFALGLPLAGALAEICGGGSGERIVPITLCELVCGVAGLTAGTVAGVALGKRRSWKHVEPKLLRLGVWPVRGGVAGALSLRF